MAQLDDVDTSARVHGPARFVAWVTLALMLITVLFAIFIAIENWSFIGV